ncbi:dihydrodipicolinate synthase family protein [Chelativorans xinjiangense]|uniref:dihydrodipicolinate synthase family protein n=1 Tax=Chelativorans xinjiangense TaxID=2681485 RepID=UPI00135BF66A|nr:dihydrodipicolinate synthase family protein [Chelativorans xinjiangense]
MTTAQDIAGMLPATITPFTASGEVNYGMIPRIVDHVFAGGAKGILPIGGTGEYTMLSNEERRRVVEVSVEAAKGRGPVIAGLLSPGYADNMLVAKDAKAVGADAVMLILPFYATGHDQGMADYVRRFRDEIDMPIVFYEIPGRTGVKIGIDHMAKLAEEGVIIGMKFSDTDLTRCAHLAELTNENFCLLGGQEGLMTYQASLGARGAVLAAANLFPRFWNHALQLGKTGQIAGLVKHMELARPMIDIAFMEPNPVPLKVGMKLIGIDCGEGRLPLQPPSKATVSAVTALVEKFNVDWGVKEYA